MSMNKYLFQFKALVFMVETNDGSFTKPGLTRAKLVTTGVIATADKDVHEVASSEKTKAVMSITQDANLAAIFLN